LRATSSTTAIRDLHSGNMPAKIAADCRKFKRRGSRH
jgi:hypothetical protein